MSQPLPMDDGTESFDFVIVGAGISGINAAYRVKTQFPHASFVILECKGVVGGTWSTFTYPGVRSDIEMWTLGFAWHPWKHDRPIAEGPAILAYIQEAMSKNGLGGSIRFHHKVLSADWSSGDHRWHLEVDNNRTPKHLNSKWLVLGTGYFDHETPLDAQIPGLDAFKGNVVNPQHWPARYEYNDKIALVGNGTTAVGLLPELAKKATRVEMIQRSPTYIVAVDNISWAHKYLPLFLVAAYRRFHYITMPWLFLVFCAYFPGAARRALLGDIQKLVPKSVPMDPHFNPQYNPWEKRICSDPDGAFYKGLHLSHVNITTGFIDTVTEHGIQMKDGKFIDVDTIITATGFVMKFGSSIKLRVDGTEIFWSKRFIWNGSMLDGVPNMTFMLGYTHNGWTLGADNNAIIMGRLRVYMEDHKIDSVTPHIGDEDKKEVQRVWPLNNTYVRLANDNLPVYGKGPWGPKTRPPIDWLSARYGNFTSGLSFSS
ncbi:putative flavin-binding monooxygenase [Xylariomycetidae sp. FL2044]|nr:putative flavin-binding monooxygenase [Xylariomycetidae sp. FL2044]